MLLKAPERPCIAADVALSNRVLLIIHHIHPIYDVWRILNTSSPPFIYRFFCFQQDCIFQVKDIVKGGSKLHLAYRAAVKH